MILLTFVNSFRRMPNTELIFTAEFVKCLETRQGFGPWSDASVQVKLKKAYKFLTSVFDQGVSSEALSIDVAAKPEDVRRTYMPPDFGRLYADFSVIAPISDWISVPPEGQGAYTCIVKIRRFDVYFACAFVLHPNPRFIVFHVANKGKCQQRLSQIAPKKKARRFLTSLLELDT